MTVALSPVKSSMKKEVIYAMKGDAITLLNTHGEVGIFLNMQTKEKFPCHLNIASKQVPACLLLDEDYNKSMDRFLSKVEKVKKPKNYNPNQIAMF